MSTSPLAAHTGRWDGSNAFRLMPDDDPAAAPMIAAVEVAAGGHLTSVRYSWEHPDDGAQDGLLVVGPGADGDAVVALWGDSWHQTPAARDLRGSASATGLVVGYAYSDDGWRWEISLDASEPGRLAVRMDNVPPPDDAHDRYAAMAAELHPAGAAG